MFPSFAKQNTLNMLDIHIIIYIIITIIFAILVDGQTVEYFQYSSSNQQFVVPSGVSSLFIDMAGARGGNISLLSDAGYMYSINPGITFGGKGGRVETTLNIISGSTLQIITGKAGTDVQGITTSVWGGGGASGSLYGTQGGGASFIELVSGNATTILVVAGGGGGCFSPCSSAGGAGGGLVGGSGLRRRLLCKWW